MNEEYRSLSAIMLTDIKGFSALNQKNESLALELLSEHNVLVRSVLPRHGGKEIKTIGDAFLVEFKSALQAVTCAIEIQKELHERNSSKAAERVILVRIGIHVGDVVHRENDIFGDGVNIASRIESLSPPGGICISDQVYAQVHNKIGEGARSIGRPELKHINYPIELYTINLPWIQDSSPQKIEQMAIRRSSTSVIVLPFHNLSPDGEKEYVGDGIAEELINGLSRLEGLRVIARTTSFSFKGKDVDLRDLSQSLGVQYVIEGSIKISGTRMRLTFQFSDAAEGSTVFSSRYDREIDDIFDVQDEIALSIIETLKIRILKTHKPVDVYTENTEAYLLYLQGRHFWNMRNAYGLEKALGYFRKSLEADEDNPLPYIGIADTYNLLSDNAGWEIKKTYPLALENVAKAIEMNENISEAHATMGYINTLRDWKYTSADRHFRISLELNPNNINAQLWYAFYFGAIGDYRNGLLQCRKAYKLDPLSLAVTYDTGLFHTLNENYDEALTWIDMALEMSPGLLLAEYFKCVTYFKMQEWDRMIEISSQAHNIAGIPSYFYGNLGVAYACQGRKNKARDILATLEGKAAEMRTLSYDKGAIHLYLGDLDAAFDNFESSVEERDFRLQYMRFIYRSAEGFVEHPRFRKLMKMINLDTYLPE